jgi:Protein of unknown function (DUF1488)
MTLQNPSNLNPDAVLLRQIGEELYGANWQIELSRAIGVGDRSLRRWAAGTDPVPEDIWVNIHRHLYARWVPIKYFDDEVISRMNKPEKLSPIPNSKVLRAHLGLHFALHTDKGRTVRCFVAREVMDDRVPRHPVEFTLKYFKDHADVFYRIAERKYNAGEIDGDLITIANADLSGEILPDIRKPIFANPSLPAVLRYDDVNVNCPTLGEAVMAWHRLEGPRKYSASITAGDGAVYRGAQIDTLYVA